MTAVPKEQASPKPSLAELSAQWARAKVLEETAKREAERLRDELLAAGVDYGYEDEHLVVTRTTDVDLGDPRLEHVLREEHVFEEAHEKKLSVKRVRALAMLNQKVARALQQASTGKPRFEQKAKKN